MPGVLQLVGDRQQLRLRGAERAQRVIDSQNALVRMAISSAARRKLRATAWRCICSAICAWYSRVWREIRTSCGPTSPESTFEGNIGQWFAGRRQDVLRQRVANG